MDADKRTYIAIDLKSFYASVECVERGLNPLTTNLVVADESRSQKTICLAVSPSLKGYGVPGRPRLFEVVAKVNAANAERKRALSSRVFLMKRGMMWFYKKDRITPSITSSHHPAWLYIWNTAQEFMAFI